MSIYAPLSRDIPLRRSMKDGDHKRLLIYQFIIDYADGKDGPTPSIREISEALGIAYASTYYHVMKLIAHHQLDQVDNKLIVIGSEWIRPVR
jgi:hypothetical protein